MLIAAFAMEVRFLALRGATWCRFVRGRSGLCEAECQDLQGHGDRAQLKVPRVVPGLSVPPTHVQKKHQQKGWDSTLAGGATASGSSVCAMNI